MISVGGFQFPETCDEEWQPTIRVIALHRQILVVAKTRIERAWKAYIGPVPGMRHDDEWPFVAREGADIGEEIARVMFPEFKDLPYAR